MHRLVILVMFWVEVAVVEVKLPFESHANTLPVTVLVEGFVYVKLGYAWHSALMLAMLCGAAALDVVESTPDVHAREAEVFE